MFIRCCTAYRNFPCLCFTQAAVGVLKLGPGLTLPSPSLPRSFLNAGDLDATIHNVRGGGIMASKKDLMIEEDVFASGCKLLLGSAKGDQDLVAKLLDVHPEHINFRDYDR